MSIRSLRTYVRLVMEMATPHQPYDGTGITMAAREREGNSLPDLEDEDEELSPHLRHACDSPNPEDDDLGPVPPTTDGDLYAVSDPYAKNWSTLPTSGRR
jgi:hypothetical protein